MFNFGSSTGLKDQTKAYGGGIKPYTKPSQSQISGVSGFTNPSAGASPDPMMLMAMLQGMQGDKGGAGSSVVNDLSTYSAPGMIQPMKTEQSPYQVAVMRALMGSLGA